MRMRDLAVRSDEKLLRAESSSPGRFRAWANCSYPEGIRLLLCNQHGARTLAVKGESQTCLKKPPKDGQNGRTRREEHADQASSVKNFQVPAMLKTTPLDCEQKQPESEEARPVVSGERAVKSGG